MYGDGLGGEYPINSGLEMFMLTPNGHPELSCVIIAEDYQLAIQVAAQLYPDFAEVVGKGTKVFVQNLTEQFSLQGYNIIIDYDVPLGVLH